MRNRILVQSLLLCLISVCLSLAVQNSQNEDTIDNEQQWNDTRNTFGTVNQLINDNFLPENIPVTETTTEISNPNISTTEPPYKITRTEFNKIISRNLRGLQRLFQIELQDALQVCHYIVYVKASDPSNDYFNLTCESIDCCGLQIDKNVLVLTANDNSVEEVRQPEKILSTSSEGGDICLEYNDEDIRPISTKKFVELLSWWLTFQGLRIRTPEINDSCNSHHHLLIAHRISEEISTLPLEFVC